MGSSTPDGTNLRSLMSPFQQEPFRRATEANFNLPIAALGLPRRGWAFAMSGLARKEGDPNSNILCGMYTGFSAIVAAMHDETFLKLAGAPLPELIQLAAMVGLPSGAIVGALLGARGDEEGKDRLAGLVQGALKGALVGGLAGAASAPATEYLARGIERKLVGAGALATAGIGAAALSGRKKRKQAPAAPQLPPEFLAALAAQQQRLVEQQQRLSRIQRPMGKQASRGVGINLPYGAKGWGIHDKRTGEKNRRQGYAHRVGHAAMVGGVGAGGVALATGKSVGEHVGAGVRGVQSLARNAPVAAGKALNVAADIADKVPTDAATGKDKARAVGRAIVDKARKASDERSARVDSGVEASVSDKLRAKAKDLGGREVKPLLTKEWFKTPAGKARLKASGRRFAAGAALFAGIKGVHNIASYESGKALAHKPTRPTSAGGGFFPKKSAEKIAATRQVKVLRKLWAEGKEHEARQMAKKLHRAGVLKTSGPGTNIKRLGSGAEGVADVVVGAKGHVGAEHAFVARKTYDLKSPLATKEMLGEKQRVGRELRRDTKKQQIAALLSKRLGKGKAGGRYQHYQLVRGKPTPWHSVKGERTVKTPKGERPSTRVLGDIEGHPENTLQSGARETAVDYLPMKRQPKPGLKAVWGNLRGKGKTRVEHRADKRLNKLVGRRMRDAALAEMANNARGDVRREFGRLKKKTWFKKRIGTVKTPGVLKTKDIVGMDKALSPELQSKLLARNWRDKAGFKNIGAEHYDHTVSGPQLRRADPERALKGLGYGSRQKKKVRGAK